MYERLGVKTVVNAAGTWTVLGGSIIDDEVLQAMVEASKYYVDMEELHKRAGEIIARVTGAEAALVTTGAAGGILLATAACIAGKDLKKIAQLPYTNSLEKNQVIIQRGNRSVYDHLIEIAGGFIVEVGEPEKVSKEEFEKAINHKTAAVAYFVRAAADKKGLLPLEDIISIAHKYNVPVIVDAAAELPPLENLRKYIKMNADLVIFSGGKAIGGPNATGILCGKKDLIEAAWLQTYVEFEAKGIKNIGRALKVGRESIVGLIFALEKYVKKDHQKEIDMWCKRGEYIISSLKHISPIKLELIMENGSKMNIPYIQLTLEKPISNINNINDIVNLLRIGDPPIWVRVKEETILFNMSTLQDGDEEKIVKRLKEIFQ